MVRMPAPSCPHGAAPRAAKVTPSLLPIKPWIKEPHHLWLEHSGARAARHPAPWERHRRRGKGAEGAGLAEDAAGRRTPLVREEAQEQGP